MLIPVVIQIKPWYISYISIIVWLVLLVEETGVPGESTDRPQANDKLYHIILYQVHITMRAIRTHNFIGHCTGSCKSKTTIRSRPRRSCLYDLINEVFTCSVVLSCSNWDISFNMPNILLISSYETCLPPVDTDMFS